ncbi:MAG: SPOR domain-containing protein [Pseudomonadota bacterium]
MACASLPENGEGDIEDNAHITEVTPKVDVLPPALRRAAYDAPEWSPDQALAATAPTPPSTDNRMGATLTNIALVQGSDENPEVDRKPAYRSQAFPSADGPSSTENNAPMALEFSQEEAERRAKKQKELAELAEELANLQGKPAAASSPNRPTPVVPKAPQIQKATYTPQADCSSLDPVIVTDNREPRARASASPAPVKAVPVAMKTPAVVAVAAASAIPQPPEEEGEELDQNQPQDRSAKAAPPADDGFIGETISVMPKAAKEQAVAKVKSMTQRDGQYAMHLASYHRQSDASNGWKIYQTRHQDILNGLGAVGSDVTVPGKGEFIRLLVGPFPTKTDARAMCDALKSRNEYCAVMRYEGQPIS